MDAEKSPEPLDLLKLLLDEGRLRVLGHLAGQPAGVRDLATQLGMKEGAVSHHVGKLSEAGLLSSRTENEQVVYALDAARVQALKRELFAATAAPAAATKAEDPAAKVLRNFVDGERLKEIPASQGKRLVILAWLASKFEVGVTYPERQVNEILQRHHPDYASLRRYLIDAGFMQRASGVYWRTPDQVGDTSA